LPLRPPVLLVRIHPDRRSGLRVRGAIPLSRPTHFALATSKRRTENLEDSFDGRPMHDDVGTKTSATLVARLRQVPPDQAAWGEFTERYGRKIYGWCRRWNLQEADAQDVT